MDVHNLKKFQGCYLPVEYAKYESQILSFEVHDSDVWILTFPKCGTTWTQEIVWLLCNGLDFETARTIPQLLRFPFIELSGQPNSESAPFINGVFKPFTDSVDFTRHMKGRRFIKTHLPWNLLPRQIQSGEKKPKIIFVTRNPKDCFVSWYHHILNMGIRADPDFDKFIDGCMAENITYSPFWNFTFGISNRLESHNIFLMKYEDMKENIEREVLRLCEYLEVPVPTGSDMTKFLDYISVDSMKKNRAVNMEDMMMKMKAQNGRENSDYTFIRKGVVGDYKSLITPEKEAILDKWIDECLEKRGYNRNSPELPLKIK